MKKFASDEERKARQREYERRYRLRHPERVRESQRSYDEKRKLRDPDRYRRQRLKHLERRRERDRQQARQQWLRYPERIRERNRQYRLKHAARLRERSRQYRLAHPEIPAKTRAWRCANPERVLASWTKHRALRCGVDVERIIRREIYDRDEGRCYLCASPVPYRQMHLDHIVPVSKGGGHTLSNVATSCAPCNKQKWAHMPPLDRVPAYARAYVDAFLSAQDSTAAAA